MSAAPHPSVRTAFPPRSRGGVALAQGRYGIRGNLELLLCDEEDGLWVLWFNSDPEGTPPEPGGPPPGEWSGALRFGAGRRYDSVQVVQSVHGPHHLEVLAVAGACSHRLRWSPESAFTDEQPPPVGSVISATVTETSDGTPWAAVLDERRRPRLLHAEAGAYPSLIWSESPSFAPPFPEGEWSAVLLLPLPDRPRPALAVLGPSGGWCTGPSTRLRPLPAGTVATCVIADGGPRFYVWDEAEGVVNVVHPGNEEADRRLALPGTGAVTALAATAPAYDRVRTDLVVRRGDGLWHLRDHADGGPLHAAPLVSRLTRVTGDEERPVHRTS